MLYGEDALKHRVSLNIFRPFEHGILKNNKEDIAAAKGLLEYCLNSVNLPEDVESYAIMGVPAEASILSKKVLTEISKEFFTGVMVASDPFCVAYELDQLENALIVDIGAGTTDLCRVHGTLPEPDDMMSWPKAGDHIDEQLIKMICEGHTNAIVTKEMAKKWKEQYGFVGKPHENVKVNIPVDSSTVEVSITRELKDTCESIIPDVVNGISKLISTYDPDFREDLRNNIIIAGGGSRIKDIDVFLEDKLSVVGGGKVSVVKDNPFVVGSKGALKLAKDMPYDYWEQLIYN